MPHLRFRGIEREPLARLGGELVEKLSALTGAPVAHFTLELVQTEFIIAPEAPKGYPFVELLWFDRGQQVQDAVDEGAVVLSCAAQAQLGTHAIHEVLGI